MSLSAFFARLSEAPESVSFDETLSVIDQHYQYQDTGFTNGDMVIAAGQSVGSCKIFAFGLLNGLTELQTLHCFGDYYRIDVLGEPDGQGHANIRSFMAHGWAGIKFEGTALTA